MAKILVIDDEPSVLATIEMILKGAGHQVTLAGEALAAIRNYDQARPDLVITDMFLPDYDGVQLISRFRRLSQNVPIIAISGHVKGNALDIAKKLGVAAVLEKPFAIEHLVNAVDEALKK